MCGITGWVDFMRDLRAEREIAQAMTDTMARRGPDDTGLWLGPHAAIGHRRLAVIDLSGGRQPMTACGVVLSYSGEVYNYRELRRALISAGHELRTVSDTEVVLHAYLEWGLDMVHRLNGMYAFAIWDERIEELILVRDRLGIKPLYYYPLHNGLLFGSEPKAILANPLAKAAVDPAGFCGFLCIAQLPETTPLSNFFDLQPGQYLRCTRDGLHKQRYWALEAHPHEDDQLRTIARVRELLEDIVARQLIADVPLCMLLSGGLDSSALTALSQARARDAEGAAVSSFAIDFAGYSEGFQSYEARETPDRPFAHDVARHVGCTHQDITLDTAKLWDDTTRGDVLRAWDFPYHIGDMDISLHLLFKAIREHSTVAISGEGADEVFGGYPWMHNPEALRAPIFPWMAGELGRGTPAPFSLFSAELLERLKLGEYVFDLYNSMIAASPKLAGEEDEEARLREFSYLDLSCFLRGLLDRKDRMSMAAGLEVRVPFCDHRLVDYVFNVPWSIKKCDGREKSLLRKATEDLLPRSVLERRKSAFPATQDRRYDEWLRVALEPILDPKGAEPVRPFVDIEGVRAIVTGADEPPASPWARLRVESVVRTNAWLKEYGVDTNAL